MTSDPVRPQKTETDLSPEQQAAAAAMVAETRQRGLELTGPAWAVENCSPRMYWKGL